MTGQTPHAPQVIGFPDDDVPAGYPQVIARLGPPHLPNVTGESSFLLCAGNPGLRG